MLIAKLVQSFSSKLSHGRTRSLLAYFVTSISGRGLGIFCQVLQVPLALRYLGKEAFGVWVTLSSIAYLISFSDLGIGMGAQNQITEALGVGDGPRARKLCLTTLVYLCAVAILLTAIGVPVFLSMHWGTAFKLKDPNLIHSMPGAMTIVLVVTCLNIPLGLTRRLAYATHQAWLDNVSAMAGSVLGLVGVFLGGYLRLGFEGYVLITWLSGPAISLAFSFYMYAKLNWLHGPGVWFERDAMRGLLNLGVFFGLQQICTLVLFGAPTVLITTLLGAAAIAPFNLVQRVFNVFQMFQNAFLLPLWPAYADAKSKSDWPWMGRTLRRSLVATLWVAIVPMIGIAFVMRPLIRLWAGDAALPTQSLVISLLLWNITVATQQPLGFFLAGVSEVKRNTLFSLLTAVAAGVLMPVLARPYGINGIVVGLVIANSVFSLTGCAYETWKYFRRLAAAPVLAPAIEATVQRS